MLAVIDDPTDLPRTRPAAAALDLLEAASRFRGRVEGALAPLGLSYARYRLLKELRDGKDPCVGTRAPGQRDVPRRSDVRQLLGALERDGMVRRARPDDVDRSTAGVALTALGAAALRWGGFRLEAVVDEFGAAFEAHDAARLEALLTRLEPAPRS